MDRGKLVIALVALVIVAVAAFALSLGGRSDRPKDKVEFVENERQQEALSDPCSSSGTYARLKQVAFEEAVRIRNADPTNLDTLATHSVVRMENPRVKSRDEELNVTVCTGRFVLELPPGAERAFGGERRLVAEVEYAAQAATDGSGMAYQLNGAEPLIYKLAAFDLKGSSYLNGRGGPEEVEFAEAAPPPAPAPEDEEDEAAPEDRQVAPTPRLRPTEMARVERPEPRPQPKETTAAERPKAQPQPKQVARTERPEPRPAVEASRNRANPSFNCRVGRSRSEQMVCNSNRLASKDRAMSSIFYSALADADPATKRRLRRSRDRFLAYRERCPDEACISQAYDDRVAEIRDIMNGF